MSDMVLATCSVCGGVITFDLTNDDIFASVLETMNEGEWKHGNCE